MHSIEKTLFSITSKFDKAITIISGGKPQSTEAATTRDDLVIHSKDRLVLPQLFSKEECGSQNIEPEHTSNVSPLSDIENRVLQSSSNIQGETLAGFERKTCPHKLFTESPIGLVRQEKDRVLYEMMKSQENDGLGPLGQDVGEVKKEPVQKDEEDKKMEKTGTVVMEEPMSCTHECITIG